MTAHPKRPFAILGADNEAGLNDGWEHEHATGFSDQFAGATHRRVETLKRAVNVGVNRPVQVSRTRGLFAASVPVGRAAHYCEAYECEGGSGRAHETPSLHRCSPAWN
jgi:hypothetical protein